MYAFRESYSDADSFKTDYFLFQGEFPFTLIWIEKQKVKKYHLHLDVFDLRDSSKMYSLAVTLASASDGKCKKIT